MPCFLRLSNTQLFMLNLPNLAMSVLSLGLLELFPCRDVPCPTLSLVKLSPALCIVGLHM